MLAPAAPAVLRSPQASLPVPAASHAAVLDLPLCWTFYGAVTRPRVRLRAVFAVLLPPLGAYLVRT